MTNNIVHAHTISGIVQQAGPASMLSAAREINHEEANRAALALAEALARYGRPEISNTDQGSQCTNFAFTSVLRDVDVRISMDGRGRWMDNVIHVTQRQDLLPFSEATALPLRKSGSCSLMATPWREQASGGRTGQHRLARKTLGRTFIE